MWLGVGDEDWILYYKSVLLGWVVTMNVMDVVFSVVDKFRTHF